MQKNIRRREPPPALFREAATRAVGHKLFSDVSVIVPPSAGTGLFLAVLVVAALIAVTVIVEVPQRTRAIGVFMPIGGLIDVVAIDAGRVRRIYAEAGEAVPDDGLLLAVESSAEILNGQSVAQLKLNSLREESVLRRQALLNSRKMSDERLTSLDVEIAAAHDRQRTVRDRVHAQIELVAITDNSIQRWRTLLRQGFIAQQQFDNELGSLLNARSMLAEALQSKADLDGQVRSLQQRALEVKSQNSLDEFGYRIDNERLQREIIAAEQQVSGEYRSIENGFIAHLFVRPGDAVYKGQVLAKLRREKVQLEALLYVSTAQARAIRVGQDVEVSPDAYPRQVFGTITATVSSVSGVALLPSDLSVPLLLSGPVFEVRASLDKGAVVPGRTITLQPGASFSADIVRSRMTLLGWLLRSLTGTAGATVDNVRI